MTTTVKQLKEHLETLPQEAKVEVLEIYDGQWCQENKFVDLDLDKYSDNFNVYERSDGFVLYFGRS